MISITGITNIGGCLLDNTDFLCIFIDIYPENIIVIFIGLCVFFVIHGFHVLLESVGQMYLRRYDYSCIFFNLMKAEDMISNCTDPKGLLKYIFL